MKKKVVKIIGIVMLSFILAYTLFIVEESIRLSINKSGEPLIVFEENYIYDSIKYESLGFSFINKFYCKQSFGTISVFIQKSAFSPMYHIRTMVKITRKSGGQFLDRREG